MRTFEVTAERGADAGIWVLQCTEHPGAISQTRRLSEARSLMAEAIGWVAGLDPDDVQIDLRPVLPADLAEEVELARRAVADLKQQQRMTAERSRAAARHLVQDFGLSGADAARVLGVSPQRVSQLVND